MLTFFFYLVWNVIFHFTAAAVLLSYSASMVSKSFMEEICGLWNDGSFTASQLHTIPVNHRILFVYILCVSMDRLLGPIRLSIYSLPCLWHPDSVPQCLTPTHNASWQSTLPATLPTHQLVASQEDKEY